MLHAHGIRHSLSGEATDQITRTFLTVRVVRGSLLLVFLVVTLVGVLAEDWPAGVAVAVALTIVLQAARVTSSVRRYRRTAPLRP